MWSDISYIRQVLQVDLAPVEGESGTIDRLSSCMIDLPYNLRILEGVRGGEGAYMSVHCPVPKVIDDFHRKTGTQKMPL
jgi:hypothetical protein